MADGRPVAVTASDDTAVRVWDLATGRPIGDPLTGHTGPVNAVACPMLDGPPSPSPPPTMRRCGSGTCPRGVLRM
ncbi:hypothetical protein ACFYUK_45365 [Nonomuraea wenchangensis]